VRRAGDTHRVGTRRRQRRPGPRTRSGLRGVDVVTVSMGPEIRVLERLGFRAPLGILAGGGGAGAAGTDGLVATTWRLDDPATAYVAQRSPVSGILGFGRLPVPWRSTHTVVPPGTPVTWPATTPSAYLVRVGDSLGRYLPVLVRTDVPV